MRKSFSRYKMNNEEGQSFVEFALVLPLLILLVMGIVQLGIIFYGQISVTGAAREGARLASVGRTDADIIKAIEDTTESTPFLSIIIVEVKVEHENEDPQVGDKVFVYVPALVDILVPFLDNAVGESFRISANATMRYQDSLNP